MFRIVFDLRPLQCGYQNRGIGRYTRELLRALGLRLAEKARFELVGLGFRGETSPVDIPVLIQAPRSERVWLWDQCVLPWRLRQVGADLFHSGVAMGPLKEVNIPIPFLHKSVVTIHDWHLWAEDADPLERFYRNTRRLRFQMQFLSHAAHVIVDADSIAKETSFRGPIPKSHISVIAPGSNHLDFIQEAPGPSTPYVLSIGDGSHKGLDTAYQAMVQARAMGLELHWIVIGDSLRVAQVAGVGNFPEWTQIYSSVDDATLKGLYRKAHCLLFPSRREGFGFPVVEAMCLGCPVLVADIEPVKSMAASKESVFPANQPETFAKAMVELQNPAFRQQLIVMGLQRAQEFTWQKCADQVLNVWDKVLGVG